MTNENDKVIEEDYSNVSDEEFLKLSPEFIMDELNKKEEENDDKIIEEEIKADSNKLDPENKDQDKEIKKENDLDKKEEKEKDDKEVLEEKEDDTDKELDSEKKQEEVKSDTDKDNTEEEKEEDKVELTEEEQKQLKVIEFYNKLTAPIKADKKEITIRTPEDAIRLIQMGVNYSRRMEELKPLRAQDSVLKNHGINTLEQLSYLIDLSKGDPKAIQKLLKEKKIDPVDINTDEESTYKETNYAPDPKDSAFIEAIETTKAHEHGTKLLTDINNEWDDSSKEFLRETPQAFTNLLAQMDSGVYDKIKEELNYQLAMGYLTDVPFLQAYNQVGDAMQKAGVFNDSKPKTHSKEVGPLKSKPTPIDTGTRKATTEVKSPTPVKTSNPPKSGKSSNSSNEVDYSTMTDDEFVKLAAPA